ncbi:MAG: hypothetical protein QG570_300 [Patescibacteria group bacterium]|nr:hypothetical protein [Patescibacteria group bacterium]
MALQGSYIGTIKNNLTEKSAIDFLLATDNRFRRPNVFERKEILRNLNLPLTYTRAFDIVYLPNPEVTNILDVSVSEITLIELKTTQKKLINNPDGFFFGATENEFSLAQTLGIRYMFCFISLHAESAKYICLTLDELETRIKRKRIQYQINI